MPLGRKTNLLNVCVVVRMSSFIGVAWQQTFEVVDTDVHAHLLKMIADLFVTIRLVFLHQFVLRAYINVCTQTVLVIIFIHINVDQGRSQT